MHAHENDGGDLIVIKIKLSCDLIVIRIILFYVFVVIILFCDLILSKYGLLYIFCKFSLILEVG